MEILAEILHIVVDSLQFGGKQTWIRISNRVGQIIGKLEAVGTATLR